MENLEFGILFTLVVVLAYILYLMPFFSRLRRKQKIQLVLISGAAFFLNLLLCVHVGDIGAMSITFYKRDLMANAFILLVCSILVIRDYFREQVFVSGLTSLLFMSVYAVAAFIMNKIAGGDIVNRLIIVNIIGLLLFCALFPLFAKLIKRTVTPFLNSRYGTYWRVMWLFPVVMFICTNLATRLNTYITTVPELIARISTVGATFMIAWGVAEDAQHQIEREELIEQVGHQKEHYEALAKKVRSERKDRHDFKHQLAAVQMMVKEGKTDELLRYCEEAEQALSELSEVPHTGNAAADSIIYHYASLAASENISFSVKGGFGGASIPDSDIICLLGNALDNAVTACETIESGRYIEVAILNRDDSLTITVDNSFDGKIIREGGRIYSRKRNHEEGIGIASMKEIVGKYGGLCRFQTSGREFEASFLLNVA